PSRIPEPSSCFLPCGRLHAHTHWERRPQEKCQPARDDSVEYPEPLERIGAAKNLVRKTQPGIFVFLLLAPIPAMAQTGSIQEFPAVFGKPQGIVAGPDGNVWLVEEASSKIAQMSPAGVLLREIPLPPGSGPLSIVVGPDRNLW